MLHGLSSENRKRLEIAAKGHALEIDRFHKLYPEVLDEKIINTALVEAKLRHTNEEQDPTHSRRDGIFYL
jgi:hypothetical protein